MNIFKPGILLLLLAVTVDCSKESNSKIGFDVPLEEESQGLTIAGIHAQAVSLHLQGWITVDVGEVKVELLDPEGFLVYERYFQAPGTFRVSETFKALTGNWKLRYQSLEARGNITVHILVKE